MILTNEAFIPKGGRGGHRNTQFSTPPTATFQDGEPAVKMAPSAWTTPLTTTHNPPAVIPKNAEQEFATVHRKTGIDILEVGYFWLTLCRQNKFDITFASPRGGPVALDPVSIESMEKDDKLKNQLKEEREFMLRLGHTYPINWIKPEDYDVVLIPGGHGAMFDLPEHDDVARCIYRVYENNGIVCAIGHGVSSLLNVKDPKTNEYIVKGKRLTCYSNAEEREKRFEDFLPYMLEDKLRERGAKVEISKPFQPHVLTESNFITGQSWPSIHDFVEAILENTKGETSKFNRK